MRHLLFAICILGLSPGVLFAQAQEEFTHESLRLVKTEERLLFYAGEEHTTPLLDLPLNTPFLESRLADPQVRSRRGSFHFKNRIKERCRQLRIDSITASTLEIRVHGRSCSAPFLLRARAFSPDQFSILLELQDSSCNQLIFTFAQSRDEHFFGLGAQYSHVQLNGHRIPVWVGEQGIGRGDQPITTLVNLYGAGGDPFTTSMPVPWIMSTKNRGLHWHNPERMIFDFRKRDRISVETWHTTLSLTIQRAESPLALIEKHTEKWGRLPALPEWAYGTIVGLQGGRDTVLQRIADLQEGGSPVDAIWIQDWVGQRQTFFGSQLRWYWEADQQHYPDFKSFCRDLNDQGIAVLGYINPFIIGEGPLYEEAREKGYFVKTTQGAPYRIEATGFDCYLFDLTNPEAFAWLKGIVREHMIDMGLSGWMADFGEWLPWDAQLHSGVAASQYHNQYPVDWARLNREAIREAGKEGEIAFFARAAFTGSNHHATFYWLGDQMVNWGRHDGLPSVVPALISGGFSGLSINHADIGGFTSIRQFPVKITRSRELLKRWIELAAFTPVFRTHESVRPRLNIQVYDDPDILQFYARFARLHHELKPYLEDCVKEAVLKGYPVVRHLQLHYPDDPEVYGLQYQYLLGSDLLVAPVVKKGKKRTGLYLPQGRWRHLWTGEVLTGGQWHKVKAAVGQPAVFFRADSSRAPLFSQFGNEEEK